MGFLLEWNSLPVLIVMRDTKRTSSMTMKI